MARKDGEPITLMMPPTTRRGFLAGTAGAVGALAFGGSALTAAAASSVSFQLRWLKDISWVGYYFAIQNGYYKQEGLNVNIIAGGPTTDVQQTVASGAAVVGLGVTTSIISARISGEPLRVIGAQYQVPPAGFISLASSNITTPKDLVGKRIATTTNGIPLVKALFAHAGLDPNGWTFVNSGFTPTPLLDGTADVYQGFCTDQGLSLIRQGHPIHCLTYDKFGYQTYDGCLVTTDNTAINHKDVLVGFLRASIKGWEYNIGHLQAGARETVQKYGEKGLAVGFQAAENKLQIPFLESALTKKKGLFWMDPAVWTNTIGFLAGSQAIPQTIPASDVMTTAILSAAYGHKTKLL